MVEVFQREGVRNPNYQVFVDNPPAWNPSTYFFPYKIFRNQYLCVWFQGQSDTTLYQELLAYPRIRWEALSYLVGLYFAIWEERERLLHLGCLVSIFNILSFRSRPLSFWHWLINIIHLFTSHTFVANCLFNKYNWSSALLIANTDSYFNYNFIYKTKEKWSVNFAKQGMRELSDLRTRCRCVTSVFSWSLRRKSITR